MSCVIILASWVHHIDNPKLSELLICSWCHRYVQASAFTIELRKYKCRQEWKDYWWRLALTCSAGWYPHRIIWVYDDAQGKASYFTNMTGVDVLTTNRWAVLNNLRLVNITITCKTWPNTTSHFSSINTHNRRMVNISAFLKTAIHTTTSKLSLKLSHRIISENDTYPTKVQWECPVML